MTDEKATREAYYAGLRSLHNEHVWRWFDHHPIGLDSGVYELAERGSIVAQQDVLGFFMATVRKGAVVPACLHDYMSHTLVTLASARRVGFEQWEREQQARASGAGRPSVKRHWKDHARWLAALGEGLDGAPVDQTRHHQALDVLKQEQQKAKTLIERHEERRRKVRQENRERDEQEKEPPMPRSYRGSHSSNARAFALASQVWNLQRAQPGLSENALIRSVAETNYWVERGGIKDTTDKRNSIVDRRHRIIDAKIKTIEAIYYRYKPHLPVPPIEMMLDD